MPPAANYPHVVVGRQQAGKTSSGVEADAKDDNNSLLLNLADLIDDDRRALARPKDRVGLFPENRTMYLNHPLVSGFPLTLRYGEERDRLFLADIFAEVWAGIPETEQTAILARGYGCVTVDVLEKHGFEGLADMGGEIRLSRAQIDTYPRNVVAHIVARQLAHKVDDYSHPNPVARLKEPRQDAKRRVVSILQRWGYPPRAKPEYTPADEERFRAISGK